jgi:hypothetical protein
MEDLEREEELVAKARREELVFETFLYFKQEIEKYEQDETIDKSDDDLTEAFINLLELLQVYEDFNYVLFNPIRQVGYTLNPRSLSDLYDDITSNIDQRSTSYENFMPLLSDYADFGNMVNVREIENKSDNEGSYFRYSHTTDNNLEKYQILKSTDSYEKFKEINKMHCLAYAVKQKSSSASNKIFIQRILSKENINSFKTKNLTKYLEDLDFSINIAKYDDNFTKIIWHKLYKTNLKTENVINIILFRRHFMINEPAKFNGKMRSLSYIMKYLLAKNLLTNHKYNFTRNLTTKAKLTKEIVEKEQKKHPEYVEKPDITKDIYVADFESIVSTEKHKPFMLGFSHINKDKTEIIQAKTKDDINRNTMLTKMFEYIIKNKTEDYVVIYFHNLKYDFALIKMNPFITIKNEISKNTTIYAVNLLYKNTKITLKDSYKIIPFPLAKFKPLFCLPEGKKQFEYYKIINEKNFNKELIKLSEVKNPDKDYIINKNYFRILKCYRDYLDYDVKTLREGIKKYRILMQEITKIDSLKYLTLPSLSKDLANKYGSFTDTYLQSGNTQLYINESVEGGRTTLPDFIHDLLEEPTITEQKIKTNKNKIYTESNIQDFDAVSLYASAMLETSFSKGKAELIEDFSDLSIYSQYIVTVDFKVNKKQQIPIISRKINNKRIWTNQDQKEITICKTKLEDAIQFNEITDIKYHRGIGWPKKNGVNDNFKKLIIHLFNERKKAKKENNIPKSNMIKLLLNSLYGKCLISQQTTKTKYIRDIETESKFNKYLSNNFNKIIKYERYIYPNTLKNKLFKVKTISTTVNNYNMCHFGSFILAQSKHNMNRVTDIANTLKINILYTDTDSLHIESKYISQLSKTYKEKYNKELIGSNLGQFHVDFEFKNNKNQENIHSRLFIGLGKKVYLDVLTNIHIKKHKNYQKINQYIENNNINPDIFHFTDKKEEYHIRFKGASQINIENYARKNNLSILDLYKKLYNGEEITLDLTDGRARFEFSNNEVKTRQKYIKKFSF